MATDTANILEAAASLRRQIGDELHDKLTATIYSDAEQIAKRAVVYDNTNAFTAEEPFLVG